MATIYDVAKLAGVSPKTVSRVLNRDAQVSPKTREKVEQAMHRLAYIPSSAARHMRSNRSGLIGLITGAVSRPAEDEESRGLPDMFLIEGVQQALARHGKTLMLADTDQQTKQIDALIHRFIEHRAEGMIYVADRHQEVVLPPLPPQCPFVLLNCFDRLGTPAVLPDDLSGQYQLTSRIIQAGHRRIAYLALPPTVTACALRTEGYKAALRDHGIDFDPRLLLHAYPDTRNRIEDLQNALNRLLQQAEPPSVICCGNDEMAVRVYGLLRIRNIRIPEDISVAGYDNYRVIADTLYPPLTTQELPYKQMGEHAAFMLLNLIERQQPAHTTALIRGQTYWRDSVTAPSPLTRPRTPK